MELPSVASSGSLVRDVTGRACEAEDQLFSSLDPQIDPEILQQTRDGRPAVLHHLEGITSSRVEVGFPAGNHLPHI
jgi:hypothetical protein